MIILIGGKSHTGKTMLAQKLLEKFKLPYTSIDHIKMGIIKGYDSCEFTQFDDDEYISKKLWRVINGIVATCMENKQNIILEGCYLPPNKVAQIKHKEIIEIYIIYSENYIINNFDNIKKYENIIEYRKYSDNKSKEEYIFENIKLKEECIKNSMKFFEITEDYENLIKKIFKYIENKINSIK